MKNSFLALSILLAAATLPAVAQTGTLRLSNPHPASGNDAPASAALATDPWEYGVFFGGGFGVGDRSDFSFTNAGRARGQGADQTRTWAASSAASSSMPRRSCRTGRPLRRRAVFARRPVSVNGVDENLPENYNGGTFSGISITPIMLRWDLTPHKRFAPYLQGAGGLIWTNHKFPPDITVPKGDPGRTSVWNFTPQFGVGMHYFIRNGQAIDLQASAVHISSASLGRSQPR